MLSVCCQCSVWRNRRNGLLHACTVHARSGQRCWQPWFSLLTLVFLLLVGDSQVDVLLWKVKVRKWNWPELEHVRAWVGSQAGRAHTCNKMLLCT